MNHKEYKLLKEKVAGLRCHHCGRFAIHSQEEHDRFLRGFEDQKGEIVELKKMTLGELNRRTR